MKPTKFDPDAPNDRQGRVNVASFRCPEAECGGAMFDVTSGLAAMMDVRHYECDKCHARYAKGST